MIEEIPAPVAVEPTLGPSTDVPTTLLDSENPEPDTDTLVDLTPIVKHDLADLQPVVEESLISDNEDDGVSVFPDRPDSSDEENRVEAERRRPKKYKRWFTNKDRDSEWNLPKGTPHSVPPPIREQPARRSKRVAKKKKTQCHCVQLINRSETVLVAPPPRELPERQYHH